MLPTLLLTFALFITLSSCHNRLVSPTPWSPTPIKSSPCGGGVSLTSPQAYWYSGSTAGIVWNVIGDGEGSLNISIDPSGGTNFVQLILTNTSAAQLGLNTYNFTVPNVTCTGANNTCSIQVFSVSGWVECTSVSILPPCTNCTPVSPPSPTCQKAVGLNFCSQYNNTNILLGAGFNAASLDLMVNESLYEYSYTMPTFLTNGTTPACQQIFKEYLCALVFPNCDNVVQSCVGTCNDFKKECGLNPTHDALYDCNALRKCPSNTDEYVVIITGVVIVLVIVIAFILNFVVRKRYHTGYTAIQ